MVGKFSAKNRENAVDVQTILAEREQAQKRRSATPKTTPKRKTAQPAAATMPTLEMPAKPIQTSRRGPGSAVSSSIRLSFSVFSFSILQLTLAYLNSETG